MSTNQIISVIVLYACEYTADGKLYKYTMSAFYPSTSVGGQLSLLQDMATDHCAAHSASLFGDGLRAPPSDPAAERHAGSLAGGSRTGFPANFLSYAGGGDFRDFCSPPTAVDASVAAAKVSPTGSATINSRRCSRGDECKDDYGGGGLDLTAMEMRDVFKTAATGDHHRPLGSPTSSSTSHRHPDHHQPPPHLQHYQLRSELLQQQQQRHEELFMQQARQWYLHQSPTTSATSPVDHPGVAELVNGRSPGAAPPPVFRREATGALLDGPHQCHWPPPPNYGDSTAPVTQRQPSDPYQKELSPTQKTGNGSIPFYPWMAVVGRYAINFVYFCSVCPFTSELYSVFRCLPYSNGKDEDISPFGIAIFHDTSIPSGNPERRRLIGRLLFIC